MQEHNQWATRIESIFRLSSAATPYAIHPFIDHRVVFMFMQLSIISPSYRYRLPYIHSSKDKDNNNAKGSGYEAGGNCWKLSRFFSSNWLLWRCGFVLRTAYGYCDYCGLWNWNTVWYQQRVGPLAHWPISPPARRRVGARSGRHSSSSSSSVVAVVVRSRE